MSERECRIRYKMKIKKEFPWKSTYAHIRQRVYNKNNHKYKYYGGKGIKCLITADELKKLWIRDKAYLMKRPSIDRIDPDGHYILHNCRYIELSENSLRVDSLIMANAKKTHCKRGHKLSGKNLIKKIGYRGRPARECRTCVVNSLRRRAPYYAAYYQRRKALGLAK